MSYSLITLVSKAWKPRRAIETLLIGKGSGNFQVTGDSLEVNPKVWTGKSEKIHPPIC